MPQYPLLLWLATSSAWLGSVQFGFHLGILNTCLAYTSRDLRTTEDGGGAVAVSALLVGAAVGAFFAGQLADALGPKRASQWNTIPLLLGSSLSAIAPARTPGFYVMLLGRLLAGWGAGSASLFAPRNLAEISPPTIRGALGALSQLFVNVGILTAFAIGLPYDGKDASLTLGGKHIAWWRVMFAFGTLPAIVQAVGLSLCPETPVWLDWKGRSEEALVAKQKLQEPASQAPSVRNHGQANEAEKAELGTGNGNGDDTDIRQPLRDMPERRHSEAESSYQSDAEGLGGEGTWGDLLEPRYRRMMILGTGLALLQQASGINSITFYSSSVFGQAGLKSPVIGSIIVGAVNTVGTSIAVVLMDKLGRRPLLIFSHAGMAVCLVSMSVTKYLHVSKELEGTVLLLAILTAVWSFAFGVGPIPWLYISEILPERIKGRAAALFTSLNWIASLCVGLIFPKMLQLLGVNGSYLIFAGLNVFAVIFAYSFMVETKGHSLQRIMHSLLQNHLD